MFIVGTMYIFFSAYFTDGFIPYQCSGNFTTHNSKICCPIPKGFSQTCGFPYRGECRTIQISRNVFTPIKPLQNDIRFHWPINMFQSFCHCYKIFAGADCGRCAFGYVNNDCSERRLLIRRNVMSLNDDELKIFRSVLDLSRYQMSSSVVFSESISSPEDLPKLLPVSILENLVFIHQFAARPSLETGTLCQNQKILSEFTDHNHNGPGFLTWHRYFMLEWERVSSEIAKTYFNIDDFTFPYWDWTDKNYCEVCINEIIGDYGERVGNDQRLHWKSTFYNWTEICPIDSQSSCIPCNIEIPSKLPISRAWTEDKFPTKSEILRTLALDDYYTTIYKEDYLSYEEMFIEIHRMYKPCRSFASSLEGSCKICKEFSMHNKIHNIATGTFRNTRTSVNDPMFVLHHTQIDRLFEVWLREHEHQLSLKYPRNVIQHGHCYECHMVGFLPPVRHKDVFKISLNFGYDYDSFQFG